MEKTYTQSELDQIVLAEVRKAIEHRATWMYLLLKEARERGLEWDEFARPAIFQTGCLGGLARRERMSDPNSLVEFAAVFPGETSQNVFAMEFLVKDDDQYQIDFHYCPLVSAWEKLGASPEEIEQLCDIAMDGDRGMASQFPAFKFSLGKTIAAGDEVCQIRFEKSGE
jgi:hypothetical protein